MIPNHPCDRLLQTGLSPDRVRSARVVVHVGDVPPARFRQHPACLFARVATPLGMELTICGAGDLFAELDPPANGTRCRQLPGIWLSEAIADSAPNADVLVDMTNDERAARLAWRIARRRSMALIAVRWGGTWTEVDSRTELISDNLAGPACHAGGEAPPAPLANIAAGLALVEVLAHLRGVEWLVPAQQRVTYNLATASRTGASADSNGPEVAVRGACIDVVGVGALGTAALASLTPILGRGACVRLFDPDVVAPENTVLQGYDPRHVGRPKVEVMAARLSDADPAVEVSAFACRYEDRPGSLGPPDLRLSCGDTFSIRHYLDEESARDGVPLIDGALAPLQARVIACVAGKTARLIDRIRRLRERAETERNRASCAAEPAVPGVNLIGGGMLVGEALRALSPAWGPPCSGTIAFDGRFALRFGITDVVRPDVVGSP